MHTISRIPAGQSGEDGASPKNQILPDSLTHDFLIHRNRAIKITLYKIKRAVALSGVYIEIIITPAGKD